MTFLKSIKNIFKKQILSEPEVDSESTFRSDSHFEAYRNNLRSKNLSSIKDLETLVKPLIKSATKIIVKQPTKLIENTQMKSHFGGHPLFLEGEEWPKSKKGDNLSFIFQVFNTGKNNIPQDIKLIQFYYDFEEFPWTTKDDGWLVKTYKNIDHKKVVTITNPVELREPKYCEVEFEKVTSLPNWEGISIYNADACELSCILNEDEPWSSYENEVEKLIGEPNYMSQFGGYPRWVQGECTPQKKDGSYMDLLFQIDSEDNAGLMWGDAGLIYVFYDDSNSKVEFILQCH